MTDFIDKFPANKVRELASQAKSQKMVVHMLTHISQDLARAAKVNAMCEDLSIKKRQVSCVFCTCFHVAHPRPNALEDIFVINFGCTAS